MSSWPVTIPQYFLKDGFSYDPRDGVVRTEMQGGAPKTRARYTATIYDITGNMWLSASERQILELFYSNTLLNGSLRFDWVHPIDGGAKQFRFTSPPKYTPKGGEYFVATIELEMLP